MPVLSSAIDHFMLRLSAVPVDPQQRARNGEGPPIEWLTLVNRQALVVRLLASTVHDVNNTLQVVSGAAEVLAMDPTPEAIARRTDSIVGQARQATAALQALTAFARDLGAPPGRARPKLIADHALALRMYALRKARIAVSAQGEDLDCAASHGRLLQVLLNLIANAEQALGGRTGATLAVRVRGEGDMVVVTVEDNGPGLPPALAAASSAWSPVPGPATGALGIGLRVSQALAAQDGGTLTWSAPPGGGAVFELSLPR